MKIVCDACSSKYSIADEKVQGKIFKIRCKKCSTIIVVRGTGGAAEESAPAVAPAAFDQKETRVYDYGGGGEAAAPGGDDAVWHVVVDQEQVGPLTAADVQARVAAGELDGESYVWREGFAEWLPLAQVPEVAAPPPIASGRAASPSPDDVFAARAAEPVAAPIGAPIAAREPAAAAAAGTASSMRGQRNESSVLFSLGNLTALAANAPRTTPSSAASSSAPASASGAAGHGGSEGSGLIDIRSMASAYLGPSRTAAAPSGPRVGSADDLPVFSAAAFSEPAVIIPMGRARNDNKMIYLLLGAVGLLAALAVVLVIVVLGKKAPAPPPAVVAADPARAKLAEPAVPTAPAVAIAPTAPTTPTDPPVTATAPIDPPATAPTDPARTVRPSARPSDANVRPTGPARDRTRVVDPPPPPPPAIGKCHLDEMGCLLADKKPACCSIYSGGRRSTTTVTPPPVEPKDLPESLTKPDISSGLAKVQAKAMACGAKSPAKGKVQVLIKVAASGAVSSVTVKESPDPALGACVQAAVQKATFARTQTGGSFQFPYRF